MWSGAVIAAISRIHTSSHVSLSLANWAKHLQGMSASHWILDVHYWGRGLLQLLQLRVRWRTGNSLQAAEPCNVAVNITPWTEDRADSTRYIALEITGTDVACANFSFCYLKSIIFGWQTACVAYFHYTVCIREVSIDVLRVNYQRLCLKHSGPRTLNDCRPPLWNDRLLQ